MRGQTEKVDNLDGEVEPVFEAHSARQIAGKPFKFFLPIRLTLPIGNY